MEGDDDLYDDFEEFISGEDSMRGQKPLSSIDEEEDVSERRLSYKIDNYVSVGGNKSNQK